MQLLNHDRRDLISGFPKRINRRRMENALAGVSTKSSETNPPLILVVDDDHFMRDLLRELIEQEGYRVAEAENGQQGLDAYVSLKPDMVLLDAIMPVMDGFTCCTQLQKIPGSDRTPVLMITSLEDSRSVDRAFEVGAIDFVTKPINWPVLRQRVRRLLEQSQLYHKLESANQELQRLAFVDGLTRVANRRGFDYTLEQEWRRLRREGISITECANQATVSANPPPLSLVLCDVDCFKLYNDTCGHLAGDRCLQQVAAAIRRAVERPADLVARYGGEEFAVLLPNTDAAGAVHVAQKIREEIRALQIPHPSSAVSEFVTVSLGVTTTIPYDDNSPAELIAAADKALYQAKKTGRDRLFLKLFLIPA